MQRWTEGGKDGQVDAWMERWRSECRDDCVIQRALGKPEVSPCSGPRATLRLVDGVFVVLRPGAGPEFETPAVAYVTRPWASAPFSESLHPHSGDGPPRAAGHAGLSHGSGGDGKAEVTWKRMRCPVPLYTAPVCRQIRPKGRAAETVGLYTWLVSPSKSLSV